LRGGKSQRSSSEFATERHTECVQHGRGDIERRAFRGSVNHPLGGPVRRRGCEQAVAWRLHASRLRDDEYDGAFIRFQQRREESIEKQVIASKRLDARCGW